MVMICFLIKGLKTHTNSAWKCSSYWLPISQYISGEWISMASDVTTTLTDQINGNTYLNAIRAAQQLNILYICKVPCSLLQTTIPLWQLCVQSVNLFHLIVGEMANLRDKTCHLLNSTVARNPPLTIPTARHDQSECSVSGIFLIRL